MTRKRFIRLVMAEGIQRNQAYEIAFRMWVIHENWEQSYRHFLLVKGHLPDLTVRISDCVRMINIAINEALPKVKAAIENAILYGTGRRKG